MNKVTTINLNGKAYQLEEAGYAALREYLNTAEVKLAGNPDKDEIMADFEQAIAEKCDACLGARKDVVASSEIEAIIKKMGPVEGTRAAADAKNEESGMNSGGASGDAGDSASGTSAGATASSNPKPKRLYRIPAGAYISGVCAGIAAHFKWDVTLVRAIFIALGILTHGGWIIAYVLLALLLPVARTEEEIADAFGENFNAHEFLEKARAYYAKYADDVVAGATGTAGSWDKREWKRNFRAHKREWKEKWRNEWRADWRANVAASGGSEYGMMRTRDIGGGFFRALIGIVMVVLSISFIIALCSLLTTGSTGITIGGVAIGIGAGVAAGTAAAGVPLWVSLVFLCALFYVIMTPLRLLMRNARERSWVGPPRRYRFFNDLMDALFFLLAVYLLIFTAREIFPAVNEAWNTLVMYLTTRRR